ncbi:MAG TPA: DUF1016 N-terminal domain-containing protein [Alphaproteobacteria bacterium]|nr:DUF1016 N-terminal domain-containing protein [Alphaproteobacteria bacterium]
MKKDLFIPEYSAFLESMKKRVATARYQAARTVNQELILLYHHLGTEILKRQKENGWGTKVIDRLSRDLTSAFPEMKGFGLQNLKYMKRFAAEYDEYEIGQQAVDQLPWGQNILGKS